MSKWEIYKRGPLPPHTLDQAARGFKKYSKKYFGDHFNDFTYFTDKEIGSFIYSKRTIKKLSDLMFDKIAKYSDKKFLDFWERTSDNLQKISFGIIFLNLDRITRKRRLSLYRKIVDALEEFHGLADISIDLIDACLEDKIKTIFNKTAPKDLNTTENFNILIRPTQMSIVMKKEKELIAISKSKNVKRLEEFQNKYFWINFGWQEQKIYSLEDIENDLGEISGNGSEKLITISKTEKEFQEAMKSKNKLLKKIGSKKLCNLINFSDKMIYYHDDRKKYQMISLYAMNKILKSIKDFRFNDLLWMTTPEMENLIKTNKVTDQQTKKPINFDLRKQGSMVTLVNQKLTYRYGPKTRKKFDQIVKENEDVKDSDQIVGIASSPGFARGKARIIFDPRVDLEKINNNDILIAPMTTPDFVSIMKKVAAIVTDEGGITCHAAIVSRELGIPCVTSTKIATSVLKDGDEVEVDANKGVVSRLPRQKSGQVRSR